MIESGTGRLLQEASLERAELIEWVRLLREVARRTAGIPGVQGPLERLIELSVARIERLIPVLDAEESLSASAPPPQAVRHLRAV